jgi:hypothetical protein
MSERMEWGQLIEQVVRRVGHVTAEGLEAHMEDMRAALRATEQDAAQLRYALDAIISLEHNADSGRVRRMVAIARAAQTKKEAGDEG